MRIFDQGRYKGVLAYPPQMAFVYQTCSSLPVFAVPLPSDQPSRETPPDEKSGQAMPLANRLNQLACKGCTSWNNLIP